MAGSRRKRGNYAKLRNILQSKKCKEAGTNKYRAGSGRFKLPCPLPPPHKLTYFSCSRSCCLMLFFFSFSGYQLSNTALSSIILRYHNKKGTIPFDIFIQILVRVIVMFGKSDTKFLIFLKVKQLSKHFLLLVLHRRVLKNNFRIKFCFIIVISIFNFKHIDLFLVIPSVKTKSRNIFQEIIQNQVIVEQNPTLSCDRNLRVGTISWVFTSKSAREWT